MFIEEGLSIVHVCTLHVHVHVHVLRIVSSITILLMSYLL